MKKLLKFKGWLFLGLLPLVYFAGVATHLDGPVAIYEDFFSPRSNFKTPLKLDIPISSEPNNASESFSLKLRRKHGVYMFFMGNGNVISQSPTSVTGSILFKDDKGKILYQHNLDETKSYDYTNKPVKILSHRALGGINKRILIDVTELKISGKTNVEHIDNLRFRITIAGQAVFFD